MLGSLFSCMVRIKSNESRYSECSHYSVWCHKVLWARITRGLAIKRSPLYWINYLWTRKVQSPAIVKYPVIVINLLIGLNTLTGAKSIGSRYGAKRRYTDCCSTVYGAKHTGLSYRENSNCHHIIDIWAWHFVIVHKIPHWRLYGS